MTEPDPLAGATVLIADDHEPNLVLLQRILNGAGVANVHVTTDSREVVRLFHELSPDIVLLDLHMPGADGVAVMDGIRQSSSPGSFIPIVVLTADATSGARDRVLDAGASDFLTKPVDRSEVVLRVRNLLRTRALHERLRSHNAELQSEVDATRAGEERGRAEKAAKRARVQGALAPGHLRVVHQPIVELSSKAIVGYEALARFDQHPRRPPNEWFEEAAEVGLGGELELAAVKAALQDDGFRDDAGPLLSLNVSPATATSQHLADLLADQPGHRLVLEITEHARVHDYGTLAAALAPLRQAGVLLAVDDAGAGFASLTHILRLRPDIIKLDISLVRDIDDDPIKRALASSLVTFADDISARITAEGIETAEECRALIDLGILWGQGYYLGRPGVLPADVSMSGSC